jgi:hypothetical protein
VSAYDFTASGVIFRGDARWRYVVTYRYQGAARSHVHIWEGFPSLSMRKSADHAFRQVAELRKGGDVYLIDTDAGRVIAHARNGRIIRATDTDNETGNT